MSDRFYTNAPASLDLPATETKRADCGNHKESGAKIRRVEFPENCQPEQSQIYRDAGFLFFDRGAFYQMADNGEASICLTEMMG